jgi:hypothetical protein
VFRRRWRGGVGGVQVRHVGQETDNPGFPPLFGEEEVDRVVPVSEVVRPPGSSPLSDEELTAEAVALLKALFPRIHDRLGATWGSKQCEDYLDRLILDDRGDREGFPPEVLAALLVLQRVHAKTFGVFKRRDPWDVGFQK